MLCRRPYMLGTLECPCGGCLPCRINRRRVWAHRILLESLKHGNSCFVTLTYSDDHVPVSLVKEHYQNFLKRLRRELAPQKIRFFVAGEYGEESGRPHFHAAIFGLDRFTAGGVDGRSGLVQKSWIVGRKDGKLDTSSLGFTFVGDLTWESAQYIAGYLTKKVVSDERSVREFSRMSLRPGIGAAAMGDVARALSSSDAGLDSVVSNLDVPTVLKHGKRMLPIGRYLRRRLRGEMGFASKDTPVEASRMYGLQKAAELAEARSSLRAAGHKPWEVEKIILDTRLQKIKNYESRFSVRDSKRRLK